jgi:pyruvate dehydrogenase E2 component (dihydrolipoamide acetyltransferase)
MPEVNVILPKYGMNMTEADIDEWLVSEGDIVAEGDDLCEVTTDKVTTTLESPTSGTVKRIVVPAGNAAEPGDILAIIEGP